MFDYLIVGAGFAGSVLAERLARGSHKKVLICDKRPHIGGNAYDHYDDSGILVHKYGPHIFHTNSLAVFEYLSRFTKWRPYEHRVLARVDGMKEKNYITRAGFKRLTDELNWLNNVERPRVTREVSEAAAEGDRSENAAYIYGKRRLREIDRRMGFLQRRLEHMQVVKAEEQQKDRVRFGAFVTIEDEQGEERVYQIVGVDEVDAKHGRISWKSPVGRALLGKQIDDEVRVRWDAGERELVVVDIAYEAPKKKAKRK